ncbi:MAG: hypothetical protein ACRDJU_04960 [Actinomycetota bacterium]
MIGSNHQIYRWNGTSLVTEPGLANDIAVGANGSVWMVSTTPWSGGTS